METLAERYQKRFDKELEEYEAIDSPETEDRFGNTFKKVGIQTIHKPKQLYPTEQQKILWASEQSMNILSQILEELKKKK